MAVGLFIVIFLVLLALETPIAFAMGVSSISYFLISGNFDMIFMLPEKVYAGLNSYVLTAIPLFMIAGEIMNKTGISEKLIEFSNMLIGRVRGGLAQVNVLASILFAGMTGVALGDIAALGKIFLPAMRKQGYDDKFIAAVTAASSLVGPIIPPSTIIILYSSIMGVSVGAMFIGAIVPGLLIGISDMLIVYLVSKKRNYAKIEVKTTPKALAVGTKNAALALVMPIIIVGGILTGIFTPTEAASVAVLYAILIGVLVYKKLSFKGFGVILKDSSYLSAKLLILIAFASIISWIFGMEQVGDIIKDFMESATDNKILLILIINLFFLFMGTWLDPGASMILFAPILAPLTFSLGVHPIQYGIMIIINSNIGFCTPPVGNVLYAIADLTGLDIFTIGKELIPFIAINFLIVFLVGIIPDISLFLPRIFGLI